MYQTFVSLFDNVVVRDGRSTIARDILTKKIPHGKNLSYRDNNVKLCVLT